MPKILIVEKLGNVKSSNVKNLDDLYKKAGFKVASGFELQHTYQGTHKVEVYGKTSGRAGQENKYDFPPPIDNTLFFGNCILVCKSLSDDTVVDITEEQWSKIYEKLFGGFHDITANDEDDSEDEVPEEEQQLLADPKTKFTKQGYVKDDFIVDDDDEESPDDDGSEDSFVPTPRQPKGGRGRGRGRGGGAVSSRPKRKPVSQLRNNNKEMKETVQESLPCQDELSEEEYFA
jgi:hypothetical protein